MKREEKANIVSALHDELARAHAVFVTDYMGLNVEKITRLRRDVAASGGSYHVVKNTLLRRAADGTQASNIAGMFVGPTAVAVVFKDPVAVARALVNFTRDNELFGLKGGVLEGRPVQASDIQELATLPPREVLLARMLGSFNAPVTGLVGVLAAIVAQLVHVLKAIENKKREGE